MRPQDYEHFKANLDGYFSEGSTALAEEVWRQPADVYRDPQRLVVEHERVFDRHPLIAACASELAEPNAYLSRSVAGTPVLLVRQEDGSVRAFLNSCRHRAVEVVRDEQSGCARRFSCPYHGWTYGPDGALVGITTRVGFPGVQGKRTGLTKLACETRHGFVFVARRPGAKIDLDAFLGPLDAEFELMETDQFVVERRTELEVDANWKLIVDGFLESYHVRFLHRASLRDVVYSDRASYDRMGIHGRLAVLRKTYDPASHEHPEDLLRQLSLNYRVFPNSELVWFADHFELWQIEPDPVRPGRTKLRMALLTRPDDLDRTERWDTNMKISLGVITGEDFVAAESAQRALDGRAAPDEVLYGRNEPAVQHFHQELAAAIA